MLRRLHEQWRPLGIEPYIRKVVLHYLDGKVHVDVFLEGPVRPAAELAGLSDSIRAGARRIEDIGEVAVYFSA